MRKWQRSEYLNGVTSRCVVEFLDTVRVSWFDYAAVISGMATSLGVWSSRRMEFSEK